MSRSGVRCDAPALSNRCSICVRPCIQYTSFGPGSASRTDELRYSHSVREAAQLGAVLLLCTGVLEVRASFWPVRRFSMLDFPALDRPANATCTRCTRQQLCQRHARARPQQAGRRARGSGSGRQPAGGRSSREGKRDSAAARGPRAELSTRPPRPRARPPHPPARPVHVAPGHRLHCDGSRVRRNGGRSNMGLSGLDPFLGSSHPIVKY